MKNANKKPPTHGQQKVSEAHHRNEYHRRVYKLLDEMGFGLAFKKLSPKFLLLLYQSRGQFLRTQPADDIYISSKELKRLQMSMYDWCKNSRIPFEGLDYNIRIVDFFEIWIPLIYLVNVTRDPKLKTHF